MCDDLRFVFKESEAHIPRSDRTAGGRGSPVVLLLFIVQTRSSGPRAKNARAYLDRSETWRGHFWPGGPDDLTLTLKNERVWTIKSNKTTGDPLPPAVRSDLGI